MATATYAFHVDWDNDGDFNSANEDISAYVVEAEWEIGYAGAHQPTAVPGWLKLTVDNSDRRFSPEYVSSPLHDDLVPMRYVRLQATYSESTYTLFYGYLWSIEPTAGQRGERRAVLHCVDGMALFSRYPLELELQENKRADEIIDAIVQAVAWPPALSGYWVLGLDGHAELGETTRLGSASIYRDFEAGRETFVHAGDTWFPEQTTALEAIRETCASEHGRFHFTRAGQARFLDRHWSQDQHSVDVTLSDSMADLGYQKGMDALYNEVIVRMDPRVEGSTSSTLWEHKGGALRLPANSVRTIRAVFVDDQGRRHGATTVITPAAGTDFTANSKADGTGADYTNDARIAVSVEAKAAGAEIMFQWGQVDGAGDPVGGSIYLTSLQLRGTPLKAFDPEEIAASDALSVTKYQRRRLMVDAPLLNDPATGYAMAHYVLMLHKDPVGAVAHVMLSGTALLEHIVARTLFDVVCVSETHTALSTEDYFVIAEHHRLTAGGALHTCTWRLEPLPPFKAWLLGDTSGRSLLGESTWLGF